MAVLTSSQWQALETCYDTLGPARLRYCPYQPTARQDAFLLLDCFEAFFGGAAGGGKTVCMGMGALQYADVPGYHALLLRPSLVEFQLPGGLMDLLFDWLAGTKAVWAGDRYAWVFPGPGKRVGSGGASVGFGFLDSPNDLARYAGTSYSFLGFDELVRFPENHYRRMLRVLRQPCSGSGLAAAPDGLRLDGVPIRVRSTSNPGGPGHGWVKSRFVDPASRHPCVVFMPSLLQDNPHLEQAGYRRTLEELPGAERLRLLRGNWDVADEGELFRSDWFPVIDRGDVPAMTHAVRYWDLAGTAPSDVAADPDYTVGLKLERDAGGIFYITDIARARRAPGGVEELVAETASMDGPGVRIVIEQEPGASGVALIDNYVRRVLSGHNVRGMRVTGSKQTRAQPVAAAAEHGLIKIVRGRNMGEFLDEVCGFPHASHDDCVDALSGAHTAIARGRVTMRCFVPTGNIYELGERAVRRQVANGSRRIDLQHRLREREAVAELAARIGLPVSDPGH